MPRITVDVLESAMLGHLVRRLVTFVLGGTMITAGGFVGAVGFGIVPRGVIQANGVGIDFTTIQVDFWGPVAAASIVTGLVLVALSLTPSRSLRTRSVTLPTALEDGLVIRVTHRTLTELVDYEARRIKGVRHVNPIVEVDANGWRIRCDLTVWRGSSMRDIAEEVTERLQDALHRHTGVNLSQLEIDVALAPMPATRVE